MVLALWYSRAASGRCYSGATCHTDSGRPNLKRSNRLVLLVGVFLAIVAFVGIVLLCNGNGRGTGADNAADPTTQATVIATPRHPAGRRGSTADQVDDPGHRHRRRSASRRPSSDTEPGHRPDRPPTDHHRRPDRRRPTSARHRQGCGQHRRPAGACGRSRSRSTRSRASGTVIKTGDYVDVLVGFTGDKFPVVTLNPTDNSITVVAGLNGTSVKLLIAGPAGPRHAAAAAAGRRRRRRRRRPRPTAARRRSTASRRS